MPNVEECVCMVHVVRDSSGTRVHSRSARIKGSRAYRAEIAQVARAGMNSQEKSDFSCRLYLQVKRTLFEVLKLALLLARPLGRDAERSGRE